MTGNSPAMKTKDGTPRGPGGNFEETAQSSKWYAAKMIGIRTDHFLKSIDLNFMVRATIFISFLRKYF